MGNIGKDEVRHIFEMLCESRYFQEELKRNDIGGYYDIGEEAITIGALAALEKDDKVSTYFRGEAAALRIKSALSLDEMMAWWMMKKSSGHPVTNVLPSLWTDVEHGVIGTTSSCIGGDMDVCCGVALAQKLLKTDRVVLLIIGDGAASKGNFHEMLNFASLQKMPLIVLVRANSWAMSTPSEQNIAVKNVSQMVGSYNIPSEIIDGNDALSVRDEVKKAADWARNGKGPYLIEATTYRMVGHSSHDEDDYRSIEILNSWTKKDPIVKMEKHMTQSGFSATEIEKIKENTKQAVVNAYERAKVLPDQDIEEVMKLHETVVNHMWERL